ncbi:MAG: metallophosphoesterase [Verrucomicrobiae bacterium]|nr:metallophosphoesterase [Verrucomicrobiae bacterium]
MKARSKFLCKDSDVSKFRNARDGGLDFIGDIHGQCDVLVKLLGVLGYESRGDGYRHPDGRQTVFLGDYIDRGPTIRETLRVVRAMVDSGDAQALMGNHEFNAVAFATPRSGGGYLRRRSEKNRVQHEATLDQFKDAMDEWDDWLDWFKTLPMWLDLGGIRAVHACWDESSMELLASGDLSEADFLESCASENTPEFAALESVLKGPELPLPDGLVYIDKQGIKRSRIRSRWWGLSDGDGGLTFSDVAMPPGSFSCDRQVPEDDLAELPNYTDATPVLVGHYWLPVTSDRKPLAPNVGCLDFSVGQGGPLAAYRWDGEAELSDERMVMIER